jgi:hypothetical protein
MIYWWKFYKHEEIYVKQKCIQPEKQNPSSIKRKSAMQDLQGRILYSFAILTTSVVFEVS